MMARIWVGLLFLFVTMQSFSTESKQTSKSKVFGQIEEFKVYDGYIDLFQHNTTGVVYFAIDKANLNKDFLYFSRSNNAAVATGMSQGRYIRQKAMRFERYFEQLEVYLPNTAFSYDESSSLINNIKANIDDAAIASLKIIDENETQLVVEAKELLFNEKLVKIKRNRSNKKRDSLVELGKLDKKLTRVMSLKSFPNNTDITVRYTFLNDALKVNGSRDLASSRSVSVELQHSFIELPNTNFKPRKADPRIGFFALEVENLTSASFTPYEDMIKRWRLEKRNPNLAMSEPKKPITWWIANNTPIEYREIIKAAILKWNLAFEKLGFINAIRVKIQPDDTTWDAADIRYNVISWAASPTRPFGGYGPSLSNPFTGEIIAADIMLEYAYITGRNLKADVYSQHEGNIDNCSLADSMLTDITWASALTTDLSSSNKILRQGLTHLVLHEVGHTLGLSHNMKSSQLYNAREVHNSALTQQTGVTASVMDYTTINAAPIDVKQGDYYSETPGPYDLWAISYGYSELSDIEEESVLKSIASLSGKHEYQFGNDADDMRTPGRHIDPRIMTHDLTSEPVVYATDRLELIKQAMRDLTANSLKQGEGYEAIRVKFNTLLSSYRQMINSVSRYVGGVYVERTFYSEGQTKPYEPVAISTQIEVLDFLANYVFAEDVLKEAESVAAYLQPFRRGFNHRGKNEDPKIYDEILRIQKTALVHLLHPNVLKRLNDSTFYGGELEAGNMLAILTRSIFSKDRKSSINLARRNLQIHYLSQLIKLHKNKKLDSVSKSGVFAQLNYIADLTSSTRGNEQTKQHRQYIQFLIKEILLIS